MATSERISIEVTDKVASTVADKFNLIAERARKAYAQIERVQKAIDSLDAKGLGRFEAAMNRSSASMSKAAQEADKLASKQARATEAAARMQSAQTRMQVQTDKAAASSARLAVENEKLATQQQRTAAGAAMVLSQQNKAASAAAGAALAQGRAAAALTEANERAAQATARTFAVQEKAKTAALQTETAQQRLAMSTSKSAEASTKATAATTNLAAANQRLIAAQRTAAAAGLGITTSQQKLATAVQNATAAHHKAAQAASMAATAQTRAASAAQQAVSNQAIAQQRLAQATAQAQAAQNRLQQQQTRVTQATNVGAAAQANANKKVDYAGLSYKQYQNSLRGIPAQITDIVVSLQGGMSPLTVLLQQGGQLKDMFNGTIPAIKALSGALLRLLIHPMTLVAGSVLAVIGSFALFESKARSINSMLAQVAATGRGMQFDSASFQQFRKQLMDLPDIGRQAADGIILSFTAMRNIGAETMKQSLQIVGDLGVALGTDTPKAAEKLASALNEPLKGAKELDKAIGFLTVSDFKLIQSFEKSGNAAAAQQVILDRLKAAIGGLQNEAMTPFQRSTTELGKAWNSLKDSLDASEGMKRIESMFVAIVNAVTWTIEKFDNLIRMMDSFEPPAWIQGFKPENWIGVGGMFKQETKPEGSWTPERKVPAGARKPTDFKTDALKPDKDAEKRSAVLAKLNKELDNEIDLLGMLGREREKQQRFDQVEEMLAGRKITLTAAETKSIKERIDAIVETADVQSTMNRMFENAANPLRQYNIEQNVAKDLLDRGLISQRDFNREMLISFDNYRDFVNPLARVNEELEDQRVLVRQVGESMTVSNQLYNIQAQMLQRGYVMNNAELTQMREKLVLIERQTQAQQAFQELYNLSTGQQQKLLIAQHALNQARQTGIISLEQYNIRMNQLTVAQAKLNMSNGVGNFADMSIAALGQVVSSYEGMLTGLSGSFGTFFTGLTDGFANSIGQAIVYSEDLNTALQNVGKQAVAGLISELVKLGIQWAVNAAIGQSVGAGVTAANTALAAATAGAWAPAAAAVSLATMGANAAPAMAGIAATQAMSMTFAIPGFEEGGHTGMGGRKKVAGVVHGQEFVVNARATARNRDLLEAMNNGANVERVSGRRGSGMTDSPATNIYFQVNNNAAGVEVTQEQKTDENGDVSLTVSIDTIESMLSGRVDSGKGKLHRSIGKAYGLAAKPGGG